MPLYEYLCRECDKQVEVLLRTQSEQPECPNCGGERLMKLLSVPSAPSTGGGGPPEGPCGSACGCFPQG